MDRSLHAPPHVLSHPHFCSLFGSAGIIRRNKIRHRRDPRHQISQLRVEVIDRSNGSFETRNLLLAESLSRFHFGDNVLHNNGNMGRLLADVEKLLASHGTVGARLLRRAVIGTGRRACATCSPSRRHIAAAHGCNGPANSSGTTASNNEERTTVSDETSNNGT